MDFQNARYCNGFPTLRRNSCTLAASISSIHSDIFSLFPHFRVTKMVTVGLIQNCLSRRLLIGISSEKVKTMPARPPQIESDLGFHPLRAPVKQFRQNSYRARYRRKGQIPVGSRNVAEARTPDC